MADQDERVTATLADGTKVQVVVDDFALRQAEKDRKLAQAAEIKERQKTISAAKQKAFKANLDMLEAPLPTYAELPSATKEILVQSTIDNIIAIGNDLVRTIVGVGCFFSDVRVLVAFLICPPACTARQHRGGCAGPSAANQGGDCVLFQGQRELIASSLLVLVVACLVVACPAGC
jgi:hypothetical protein